MDLDDLYRVLRGAHVQAQGIVDTLRDPVLVLDEAFKVISANPAFYKTFETGRDDTLGRRFSELGDGQWNIPALGLLLEKVLPKTAIIVDYEVAARFPHIGERTMLASAERLCHPDSGQRLILLTIVDATERRARERESELLLGETRHRVKNLLSVIQALARQTKVEGASAREFRDTFLDRFGALSRSLEASMECKETTLADLARASLEPFLAQDGRLSIGPDPEVWLQSGQAMAVGMILHELATNAAKYGALSSPAGRVSIGWSATPAEDGRQRVKLFWAEEDGPEVEPPARDGFGSRLMRSAVERDLHGEMKRDFSPAGLRVVVTFDAGGEHVGS